MKRGNHFQGSSLMIKRSLLNSLLLSSAFAVVGLQTATGQEVDTQATDPEATVDEERKLQAVVIRGEFIPEPQRQTSQVATFLSSEDLARTGDDNAALALTRLSGLSVVSGKFAYVRGLGDRYSSARLNGSPLPSPEPLRRTVPLDLFPSNILDGAAVQKTFSPDFPGEFGGGVIDLKTLRVPSGSFLNIKAGVGYNTETTGSEGYFVRGGDYDGTGYDDGTRDIPGPLQSLISSGTRLSSLSSTDLEAVGESLVNSPLSVIQSSEIDPNYDVSIDGGKRFDFGAFDLGIVGVGGFSSSWQTKDSTRQRVEGGFLANDINTVQTSLEATTNALVSTSATWENHLLQATGFYVHSTSKEAQISQGIDFSAPGATGEVFDESTGWYERELMFGQLRGEHTFDRLEFTWRGSASTSTRDAPYERFLRRFPDSSGTPIYSVANNYTIRFSELTDDLLSGGMDVSYTFDVGPGQEGKIQGGLESSTTDREFDLYGFRFAGGNSLPLDVQQARPDYLFSPDNISPNRFVLQEVVSTNDSYAAELDTNAGYVLADIELFPFIRIAGGIRYEEATQSVRTFDRFGNPGAGTVDLVNDYVLPSATFTWNFADDLQFRLAYSETITRPQFRELARSSYFDPDTGRTYRGNNGLVDSQLKNYDTRLEYYLGRNQFVTVAGFFKEIERPIEEVQFSPSTFVYETTFINSPSAEIAGFELEYRNRFAMPLDGAFFEDREWLFSANYTYTSSEVKATTGDLVFDPISGTQIDATRFGLNGTKLQGTPENILNLQFGWEGSADQLTLLVGWVDERILQRGLNSGAVTLPDVIEKPGVQLDLVYKRDIPVAGHVLTWSVSGRNLLNEAHEEFQTSAGTLGRTEYNTYERGMSFSTGLTAKF
jgi:outer membrane receptor protein involved in Fe transport